MRGLGEQPPQVDTIIQSSYGAPFTRFHAPSPLTSVPTVGPLHPPPYTIYHQHRWTNCTRGDIYQKRRFWTEGMNELGAFHPGPSTAPICHPSSSSRRRRRGRRRSTILSYAFSSLRRRPPESRATAQLIWLRIFASSEPRGLASSESSPAEIVVNLGCVASCRPAQIDLLVDRSLRFLLCHSKSDTSCCIACLRGTSGASLISWFEDWQLESLVRAGAGLRWFGDRELEFEDWATLGALCLGGLILGWFGIKRFRWYARVWRSGILGPVRHREA